MKLFKILIMIVLLVGAGSIGMAATYHSPPSIDECVVYADAGAIAQAVADYQNDVFICEYSYGMLPVDAPSIQELSDVQTELLKSLIPLDCPEVNLICYNHGNDNPNFCFCNMGFIDRLVNNRYLNKRRLQHNNVSTGSHRMRFSL